MNTPPSKKQQQSFYDPSSEKSDFSINFQKACSHIGEETNRLKIIIKNLENKVLELENKNRQQELGILDYLVQMNNIKSMEPPPEDLSNNSIEFFKIKISAYENVIPPSFPYPLIILENILTFTSNLAVKNLEDRFTMSEERLDLINKKLLILKKNLRNFKKSPGDKNNVSDSLLEALNMMKNQIINGKNKEDLIYSDGWKISFQLPEFRSILALLNSEIQGEEITKCFYETLSKRSFNLKANLGNFLKLVEIFPEDFKTSENMNNLYKSIIKELQAFDFSILKEFKLFLDKKIFNDIELQQKTLIQVLNFHRSMMNKADSIQDKLDSLFIEFKNFVREIFKNDDDYKIEAI